MNQTGSTKVLYSEELAAQIGPLLAIAPSFSTNAVPDFQTMLESHPERYPYLKSFSEARNDPVVVLHSSGSTGESQRLSFFFSFFWGFDTHG